MSQTHQPRDQYGQLVQSAELVNVALARKVVTVSQARVFGLETDARFIEIYAISKDSYLKWATSDKDYAKATNFDEVIISGTSKTFEIPIQIDGSLYENVSVVGRESGGTVVVVQK